MSDDSPLSRLFYIDFAYNAWTNHSPISEGIGYANQEKHYHHHTDLSHHIGFSHALSSLPNEKLCGAPCGSATVKV
jgi:hypothetical protein